MNPSKAKRRANKHKHRDQAARRKSSVEKRPEQLELPVSMPEQVAAKPESQAKAKAAAQHKTKPAAKAAKTETTSPSRFQVASGQTARAGHKAPQRKPKSAQYATVRPAKTARPVADAASLSSPASDKQSKPALPVWRLYVAMLLTALLTVWFSQDSINAYWQQTYHRASPLEKLNDYGWWRSGSHWQQAALERHEAALSWLETKNESWRQQHTAEHAPPSIVVLPTEPTVPSEAEAKPASAPVVAQNTAPKPLPERVQLSAGDKVFFAGDSMMEGVAPHVQRWLSSQYGIDSLNLSRQSTGLSYPSFFDWPATIEKTLREDQKIRLLVVFLGPNDPWDFPNPEPGTRGYLKFQSPEWEQVYRQRIERIVTAAKAADVQIIWLGVPLMKSSRLNAQMRYLDSLFASELAGKTIWLPTDKIMGGEDGQYRDSISINGQTVRLRSKDGIHFTIKGQQFLADQIAGRIDYRPANAVAPATPAASETLITSGKS